MSNDCFFNIKLIWIVSNINWYRLLSIAACLVKAGHIDKAEQKNDYIIVANSLPSVYEL
jgi:predicted transcriptional regulator